MRKYILFKTALGVCGISWSAQGIGRVQLPEASREKTVLRLLGKFPALGVSAPPPWVKKIIQKIKRHLDGVPQDFSDVHLDLSSLPPFHQRTLTGARSVQAGKTITYGELAKRIGSPKGARAVGQALAKNPFAILVPCHRILSSGSKLGGFSAHGGLATKMKMLVIEGVTCLPAGTALAPNVSLERHTY